MSELAERIIELSSDIYSLRAVKKAAYKLTDRLFLEITETSDSRTLLLSVRRKSPDLGLDEICGELMNEILDQDLRESIAAETEALRNLILAHALSRVPLLDGEAEEPQRQEPSTERA